MGILSEDLISRTLLESVNAKLKEYKPVLFCLWDSSQITNTECLNNKLHFFVNILFIMMVERCDLK